MTLREDWRVIRAGGPALTPHQKQPQFNRISTAHSSCSRAVIDSNNNVMTCLAMPVIHLTVASIKEDGELITAENAEMVAANAVRAAAGAPGPVAEIDG